MEINFEKQQKIARNNKLIALAGVVFVLILSFILLFIVFCGYHVEKPILEKKIVTTGLDSVLLSSIKLSSDTSDYILLYSVDSMPVVVNEHSYDSTIGVLLYVGIWVFVVLVICGVFMVLLKVLKFENDLNLKIFDVYRDIYKETEMWALAERKKKFEKEEENKALGLREGDDGGLEYKKFDLEKKKIELKHKHELEIKDRDIELKKIGK